MGNGLWGVYAVSIANGKAFYIFQKFIMLTRVKRIFFASVKNLLRSHCIMTPESVRHTRASVPSMGRRAMSDYVRIHCFHVVNGEWAFFFEEKATFCSDIFYVRCV